MKKSLALLFVAAVAVTLAGASCSSTTTTNTNTTANKNTAVVNKNVNKATANSNTNAVANSNVNATATSTITTDATTYKVGDKITVAYNLVGTLKDGAWIGIVPAATAHGLESDGDAADVDWDYLSGSTSGTITTLTAPDVGTYEIRVYDTEYDGGIELGTSAAFTVTE